MSLSRPITCTSLSPQVRRLFTRLNQTEMTVTQLSAEIGVNTTTIMAWAASRRQPRIDNLEAAFNVLGYTLIDRPMEPAK
jgi:transcriptional regulator with XRE-family HTH domain